MVLWLLGLIIFFWPVLLWLATFLQWRPGSILSDHYAELNLHIQFLFSHKTTLTNTINKVNWNYVTNSELLNFRQYQSPFNCHRYFGMLWWCVLYFSPLSNWPISHFPPTMHLWSFFFVPSYSQTLTKAVGMIMFVKFKLKADFWYWVWTEAGSPKSGVLFKKHAKSRYKYQIRKLKRREE